MGRLTVRLPDALHQELEDLAHSEGVSLNHYLVYALTRQATLDARRLSEKGASRRKSNRSAQNSDPAGEQHVTRDMLNLREEMLPPPSDQ